MSEPTLEDVMARMDDLLKEVRRQGRAAIAAQAAAESCLEAIHALPEAGPEGPVDEEDDDDGEILDGDATPSKAALHWLRALIPVLDALDRVAAQAHAAAAPPSPPSPPRRSWLHFLFRGDKPAPVEDRRLIVLAEGLRILQNQLRAALVDLGVGIDRRAGAAVDPERHRVVEARPAGPGEQPGMVVEIVRPGYALGAVVVREAEVVATGDAVVNA